MNREELYYKNLSYEDLPNEKWKPIEGYEKFYQVSNLGRIRSINNFNIHKNGFLYKQNKRVLKQSNTSTGYLMVRLRGKNFKVHRLVANAFIENINNKQIINHKNFDTKNNVIENLEWCTQKENINHAIKNKRNKAYSYCDKQKIIDLFCSGFTSVFIAKELNITKSIVNNTIQKSNVSRKEYPQKSKYNISIEELKTIFKAGYRNKEISMLYNIPSQYIARRKYQIKIGEI